jgi:hypothetical protein
MRHHRHAHEHGEAGPPPFMALDELILPSWAKTTEPVHAVVTWSFLPAEQQPDREEPAALRRLAAPLEQMAQASPGEESLLPRCSGLPGRRAVAIRRSHRCRCASECRGP